MESLEKSLENKKNQLNFLKSILRQTDPYTKRKHAKLNSFYDRAEREKVNRKCQKLEKEIKELEELLKKRC